MTAVSAPLRIGLVGAGSMGGEHALAIARLPGSRLIAAADPEEEAARELVRTSSGAKVSPSLEELLDRTDPDIVHVCSPPALHYQHARTALDAGTHVYVEKPFTESVEQADELFELARERNLKICAGHQLKYAFPRERVRQYLDRLAPVTHIESHFHFVPSAAKQRTLRADEQLLDVLPHPTYLLLDLLAGLGAGAQPVVVEALTTGPAATVHVLVRQGDVTGLVHASLEGRPVDSHLRVVGRGGELTLDHILDELSWVPNRGGSGLGKILNPLGRARQTTGGAVRAGLRHVLGRGRSYPGLDTLIGEFHEAVVGGTESPVSASEIRTTVHIVEQTGRKLEASAPDSEGPSSGGSTVVVTGGTGFLGRPVVRSLADEGASVRCLSRRGAPPWERIPGAEYVTCDLSRETAPELFSCADVVVHAAAATAGGWDAHRRHSIEATENVLRAAARAGVPRVLYVSSLAVVASDAPNAPITEDSPLLEDPRSAGPYAWGKTEAERRARTLAGELGIDLKVVRPGAVVDGDDFEPPGRLGRSIGPLFVAVGSSEERMGVVDRGFAARMIARGTLHFDEFPSVLHLLDPELPTRGELVDKLKIRRPDVRVVWLPRFLLPALDPMAVLAQRLLQPGEQPISLTEVFGDRHYDTEQIAKVVRIRPTSGQGTRR